MADSTLDKTKLGDVLVDVVDTIRGRVRAALGTRPYRVTVLTRRWSGGQRGVGTPSDSVLQLEPAPRVERVTRDRLGPGGREKSGQVVLTEVSLRYTEAELVPPADEATEFAYVITEAHGQRQKPQFYALAGMPIARRGDNEGDRTDWRLVLEQTSDLSPIDSTDA